MEMTVLWQINKSFCFNTFEFTDYVRIELLYKNIENVCFGAGVRVWRQGSELQLGSSPQRSQPLRLRVSASQGPRPCHQQDTDGRRRRKSYQQSLSIQQQMPDHIKTMTFIPFSDVN